MRSFPHTCRRSSLDVGSLRFRRARASLVACCFRSMARRISWGRSTSPRPTRRRRRRLPGDLICAAKATSHIEAMAVTSAKVPRRTMKEAEDVEEEAGEEVPGEVEGDDLGVEEGAGTIRGGRGLGRARCMGGFHFRVTERTVGDIICGWDLIIGTSSDNGREDSGRAERDEGFGGECRRQVDLNASKPLNVVNVM